MNNSFIKYTLGLFVGVGLLLCSATGTKAQGTAVLTTNLTVGSTNTIITNACYVSEIDLISGSGTTSSIQFFDQKGGSNTYAYTNAYVTRTTFFTNIVQPLTNGLGQLYTNTYPGEFTVLTTNNPATNALPVVATFSSVANTRQARSPLRLVFVNGVTVVTDAAGTNQTVVVYYSYPF